MSNMDYCRFQNTVDDLQDCIDAWEDVSSAEEKKAQARMLKLCKQIVEEYGEEA